jgi:putative transposase
VESNGKKECIRPKTPLSLKEGRSIVSEFVKNYNTKRPYSAILYIAPIDKLEGRWEEILEERKRKLKKAKIHRKQKYLDGKGEKKRLSY